MRKQERADHLRIRLDQLYPETPIPLDHSDEFTLLVAVLLSAQCTDKKVNEVTPALFRAAPTPEQMRALGEDNILEIIRPLGLSKQKAKSLAKLSGMLIDDHGGHVPPSFEDLEKLPGVGHKTAQRRHESSVWRPGVSVDTHIHRLAQRWGLSSGKNVVQTERDLKEVFPDNSWNKLHLQIIFYGREYCTARGCDGTVCPLCVELYPRRKKPVVWIKP